MYDNLTPEDVIDARWHLLHFVPAELANQILDDAEYWPSVSRTFRPAREVRVSGTPEDNFNATKCCLLTPRIPSVEGSSVKVMKICFTIQSHDQGWAGESLPGPYQGSYTWFQAAIVRGCRDKDGADVVTDDKEIGEMLENGELYPKTQRGRIYVRRKEVPPSAFFFGLFGTTKAKTLRLRTIKNPNSDSDVWDIQRNLRASHPKQTHEVTWTSDTDVGVDEEDHFQQTGSKLGVGFIQSLQPGDRIAILARAQYPGWMNFIQSISVDIYSRYL